MSNVAKHVITKFGKGTFAKGVPIVAEILGIHTSRVYRTTYPKEKGGTGGLFPAEHQQPLLDAASDYDVELEPSDFFDQLAAE